MHGRLKIKTTAEQQLEKEKERAKKLQQYNALWELAMTKRKNGEKDSEALNITSKLLFGNPDLYSMWNYRKEILGSQKNEKEPSEFQTVMNTELNFTDQCLRTNHKSYGSWQQRVWVLENMPEPNWIRELQLCNKFLELDERNFHCWDYRRYIVQQAKVDPQAELEFSDAKISANFSNYSSWHYRSKLLPKIYPDPENLRPIAENKLLQEFQLVQNAAFTDPNDQSAWFYHRWLLGGGRRPLRPICLYVSNGDDNVIIVAFNRAVSCEDLLVCAAVIVNGDQQDVHWRISDGKTEGHSPIWIGTYIPSSKDSNPCDYSVCVTFKGSSDALTYELTSVIRQGENECWTSLTDSWLDFSIELSAATSSVLSSELDSCIQLQELEPDSKWPLLTAILLMKSLDFDQFREPILQNFDKLLLVDPRRENYYHDLRSKFLLENEVRTLGSKQTELNLCGHSLSVFYHQEYFLQLKVLDLTDNCLSSIRGISLLVRLENLIVDRNRLVDLDGIQGLTKLQILSVRNNSILGFGCIHQLAPLPVLVNLNLNGNGVCNEDDYRLRVKKILPRLLHLDE